MRKRVLVVDDDLATRHGLAELLSHAGYAATATGSFHEAKEILRVAAPDLLITDIRLGEYNGLQLVLHAPLEVHAIVISGFADPVLEREAVRAGASVIHKPIDVVEFVRFVKRLFDDDGPDRLAKGSSHSC